MRACGRIYHQVPDCINGVHVMEQWQQFRSSSHLLFDFFEPTKRGGVTSSREAAAVGETRGGAGGVGGAGGATVAGGGGLVAGASGGALTVGVPQGGVSAIGGWGGVRMLSPRLSQRCSCRRSWIRKPRQRARGVGGRWDGRVVIVRDAWYGNIFSKI